MIVGTAGHIDHGKTTLVRALTGVDTDRLPEEKARGISIDLGYAYSPLASGEVLGFVDVPGHERFVHTMLAGATGIDVALLIVAADDGVMPQTREHFNILRLLGVPKAVVALTKVDMADASRVVAVEREVRTLLSGSAFADAPMLPCSGRTGAGVEALRQCLDQVAQGHRRRAADAHFRLAVDRSFTLPGIGTVVTGTVHSGEVHVGAGLVIAPSGREVRVRSIHAQDREAQIGMTGQRCALNLPGVAREDIARGDWIVAPPVALACMRFDARVALLGDAPRALRSGTTVHVHCGAAHAAARLVFLDDAAAAAPPGDSLAPGATRLVQLVLQRPVAAWRGDRFIIRDASATRTIGGGTVLDPFAPARYRASAERRSYLGALEAPTPELQLTSLIDQSRLGVDLDRFARGGNVMHLDALIAPLAARRVTAGGVDYAIGDSHWNGLQRHATEAIAAFHLAHPDQAGPDRARLKRIAFPRLDQVLYGALVADLVATGKLVRSGPWLHLPGHDNAPTAQERALLEKVLPRLLDVRFDPPWVRDLGKAIAQPEALLRAAMIRASKRGEMFQVVRDLFYHPAAIRDLAAIADGLQHAEGEVRAAAFRDATGLGRKRAIQILEFFDRVGFTRRVRDKHLVRADNPLALETPPGRTDVAPDASSSAAQIAT